MKNLLILISAILSSMVLFSSCEEEMFDVSETFTFEHDFVVSSESNTFNNSKSVNLTEESALMAQYVSTLKDVEVESVRYWIKSYKGTKEQTVTSIIVQVANADGTGAKNAIDLKDVPLQGLLNNPKFLDVDTEGILKLEELAKIDPFTFSYVFNVESTETPIEFTLSVEVVARLTTNPLFEL
jgi:hypothetical protein